MYGSITEGAELATRVARRFEPEDRRSARLEVGYRRYQEAVRTLRPLLTGKEW